MQKIVTVHGTSNNYPTDILYKEIEYPVIASYLTQGYTVSQMLPIVSNSAAGFGFTIIFVLEKK